MRSTDRGEMANRSIWRSEQGESQAHASSSHHSQGTRRNCYAHRCCRDCKRIRTKPQACRRRGGGNDRTDSHMVESSLASLWNRRRRSNTARSVTDPRRPRVRTQAGSDTRSHSAIDESPGSTLAHRQLVSDQLRACQSWFISRSILRVEETRVAQPHVGRDVAEEGLVCPEYRELSFGHVD